MSTLSRNPGTVYNASEGKRFAADTTLVVVSCATCGVTYAIPASFDKSARKYHGDSANGWSICCPFGHTWHYTGETEVERAKRLLKEERERAGWLAAERDQARASARAEKAAKTRIKNQRDRERTRVANGVCPCCNRTFQNLARHMEAKHPGHATSEVEPA